jgi:hypothetical protein
MPKCSLYINYMNESIKTSLRSFALGTLLVTLLTSSNVWWSLTVYTVAATLIYFTDFKGYEKTK